MGASLKVKADVVRRTRKPGTYAGLELDDQVDFEVVGSRLGDVEVEASSPKVADEGTVRGARRRTGDWA
ncbi:MAG: hypothetical protein ACYCPV_04635, partial [Thermoplasmata archaeon]